jgi:hypothetical protein
MIDSTQFRTTTDTFEGGGELWPTHPASAVALVKNGAIIGYEVVNGGSGYSSTPTIYVPGFPSANPQIKLSFSKDFDSNGSISTIK